MSSTDTSLPTHPLLPTSVDLDTKPTRNTGCTSGCQCEFCLEYYKDHAERKSLRTAHKTLREERQTLREERKSLLAELNSFNPPGIFWPNTLQPILNSASPVRTIGRYVCTCIYDVHDGDYTERPEFGDFGGPCHGHLAHVRSSQIETRFSEITARFREIHLRLNDIQTRYRGLCQIRATLYSDAEDSDQDTPKVSRKRPHAP